MRCKACGIDLYGELRFCPHCGKNLFSSKEFRCAICGEILETRWKLCPMCGETVQVSSGKAETGKRAVRKTPAKTVPAAKAEPKQAGKNGFKKFKMKRGIVYGYTEMSVCEKHPCGFNLKKKSPAFRRG